MIVVLYAYDMEPITVINLPHVAYEYLVKHGTVRLSIPTRPVTQAFSLVDQLEVVYKIVNISAERIRFHDTESLMFFTHDEEMALQLEPAFTRSTVSSARFATNCVCIWIFNSVGEDNGN